MAIPGPKPKPTAVKELEGNLGHRRLNDSEPQPVPEAPPMPTYIAARPKARAAWEALVEELRLMGTLARSDGALIMVHAVALADYADLQESKAFWAKKVAAEEERAGGPILAHGQLLLGEKGQPYMNQLVSREASVIKILGQTGAELGLSPTSRSRLHVDQPKKGGELQVVAWDEQAG